MGATMNKPTMLTKNMKAIVDPIPRTRIFFTSFASLKLPATLLLIANK